MRRAGTYRLSLNSPVSPVSPVWKEIKRHKLFDACAEDHPILEIERQVPGLFRQGEILDGSPSIGRQDFPVWVIAQSQGMRYRFHFHSFTHCIFISIARRDARHHPFG